MVSLQPPPPQFGKLLVPFADHTTLWLVLVGSVLASDGALFDRRVRVYMALAPAITQLSLPKFVCATTPLPKKLAGI